MIEGFENVAGSGNSFYKEDLVMQAKNIFGNVKDAKALVDSIIPEEDIHGDIENLIKRIKCYTYIKQLEAFINNPENDKLEKISNAAEYIFQKLLTLTSSNEDIKEAVNMDKRAMDVLSIKNIVEKF